MDDLLAYYERELGLFRDATREFAARYPKTAGNLLISGDNSDDPHTSRVIQSVAMLAARVQKRLDDDLPQHTEALLDTVFPHYLRPFPSCSIVRFDDSGFFIAKIAACIHIHRYLTRHYILHSILRFPL